MVKVKWSPYRPGVAQRAGRGIALLFHDRCTRRCEWSAARPGRTLPSGKTRYQFYRRLGGPQGRSGRAENLVPTGIRSRTVQPVVSRYIDWATQPTALLGAHHIFHVSRLRIEKSSRISSSADRRFGEPCCLRRLMGRHVTNGVILKQRSIGTCNVKMRCFRVNSCL